MKITINGNPKEIADLAQELQNRQKNSIIEDYGLIEHFDNILKQRESPCPEGDPGERGMPTRKK